MQLARKNQRQEILKKAATDGEHPRELKDYAVEGVELQSRKAFLRATKKRDFHDLNLLLLRRREDGTLEVAKGRNPSQFAPLDLSSLEKDLLQDIDVSIVKNHPEALPRITQLFKKHLALLGDDGALAFPEQTEVQHSIEEIPGSRPVGRPVYRLSQPQLLELQKQLAKLLDAGLISPSSSPYAAPILFAPKKDGGLRMCTDYRLLNSQTVKDRFPLPHPDDLFDQMRDSKYFTTIDLLWGYWHIPIHPDHRSKTGFRTQFGHFEWNVLPFGLTNAPATFQRYIARCLQECITSGYVVQFIDDMCIHSRTLEEHLLHVSTVLNLLEKHKLRTKPSKCHFFQTSISFLGHVISADGLSTDPQKTRVIAEWPTPRDVHDLRSFLGLANYYRRFIPSYSELALPLFPLLAKGTSWTWGDPQVAAFNQIKAALICAPVLKQYNPDAKISRVVTDASKFALGGVLMQGEDEQSLHPVAFYSRKFSSAECNYTTREQELLAIKECLRTWRHYVQGIPIQVHTDHDSLRFINTQENLTGRLARWFEFFQEYLITEIKHVKGVENVVADALSRRPDYAQVFNVFSITPLVASVTTFSSNTFQEILEDQLKDPLCQKLVADLRGDCLGPLDPVRN